MRNNCCKFFLVIGLILVAVDGFSQLTPKDFKTSLDDYLPDSLSFVHLTKKQLLGLKEVRVNFNWAHMQSVTVYFAEAGEVTVASFEGSKPAGDFFELVKRCSPRSSILFIPVVKNNKGQNVRWSELPVIVIE